MACASELCGRRKYYIYKMKYSIFGRTGKSVSRLGMGGMRFEKEIPEKDCVSLIRYAHDKGVNYFDTAPVYNEDRSESIYGRAFSEMDRDAFYVATKGDNAMGAAEITRHIERSLRRLKVEKIDFYFLWCVINPSQYRKALQPGRSLEAILKAKERGLIRHVGISSHMYSNDIDEIIDSQIFEFMMVPYNALNFSQRKEALVKAFQNNMGTVVMNPFYGGNIPQFKDIITIFPDRPDRVVEDSLLFCLEAPEINIALAGMNRKEMVDFNTAVAEKSDIISPEAQKEKEALIHAAKPDMCTSCGYCLAHCPEKINIRSYMEIYNHYQLTGSVKETKGKSKWYHQFGPIFGDDKRPSDCTECLACEEACTQYLNITERLKWLDENL
jgi:predicted aldo/keto reductase-like oxidoreductase